MPTRATMLGMNEKTLDFDCGIAYERLFAWLDEELALARSDGNWTFEDGGSTCTVALEPLENRSFARLELERAHLVVRGHAEAVATFEKLFTLRFMSAGG